MAVIYPNTALSTDDDNVRPRPGIISGEDSWAERVDEHLEGFGES